MASVLGSAIVRRCNAVINTLDWYGNIVSVPMSFAKMGTLGNESHASENSIVAKNYMACICQLNEHSKNFGENTRIILGNTAYSMRGVNNFTREFTGDPDSVHLMTFTIEKAEVLCQDSIEKQCADYHSFKWDIELTARKSMNVGGAQKISVAGKRNGKLVESSEEHPIDYIFNTEDKHIADVDADGNLVAKQVGETLITVTLAQNPDVSESFSLAVADGGESYIEFTSEEIETLSELQSAEISAVFYENGIATEDNVIFSFSGAPLAAYSTIQTGFNKYKVTCYTASQMPLKVTVTCREHSKTMTILLTA